MAKYLRELEVSEISSVNRGANGFAKIRFLKFLKHDKPKESQMTVLEQVQKAAAEGRLSRADVGACLDAQVSVLKRDDETEQRALSRLLDQRDPVACELFNLVQQMGRESAFQEPDHYVNKSDMAPRFAEGDGVQRHADGTPMSDDDTDDETPQSAYSKLTEMARAHREKNPSMSHEQSFAHVMMKTPEGRALASKANAYRPKAQLNPSISDYREPSAQGVHGVGLRSTMTPDMSRATR
jgi:hypothetical protein